ncbi:MAG TPA: hypothetical protein VFZ79_00050 [Acidimicrobiales bacterium]
MAFTCGDLVDLAGLVAGAWRTGADRDWSVPAGTLAWTCARTADHAVDTVLAPAFFLASRRQDDYPPYGASTPGPDARPELFAGAVETAAPFTTPEDLCDRLRRHTASWPHWRSPGWAPLALSGDPWGDLLRASGRRRL